MRVLILDDHAMVRDGLRLLFDQEDDIDVVAEATSLQELAAVTSEVDIVVADLVLQDGQGDEVVRAVRASFPDALIVVVTMVEDPDAAVRALEAGASGFVPKHAAAMELVDALRRVERGERYVQPSVGAEIAARRSDPSRLLIDTLSDREVEVLRLVAAGLTNAAIAEDLGIGLRTVEAHRSSVSRKLDRHSRAELVQYCWDAGLIAPRHA